MDIGAIVDAIVKIYELVTSTSSTAFLSVVGFALLLIAGVLAYIAIKSKPEELSLWIKLALFISLLGGMLFSAAGPSLALFYVSQSALTTIQKMGSARAFKNLEENKKVDYVVRLIAYDQGEEPKLGIDQLKNLGPPDQIYSFVASYDELVGYTVKEAIEKIGQRYVNGNGVSAIIFPLRTNLFPANARGLVQVVQEIEQRKDIELKKKFLEGANVLNPGELKDLSSKDIPSYRIVSFRDKYRHYCELSHQFYCEPSYSARTFVGGLSKDWHPLGFSQRNPPDDACSIPVGTYCDFQDWEKARGTYQKDFGSRAFLIRNLEINRIPGRILIDFDNPNEQVVPEIGAR
jgi:hypothetical protein